MISFSKVIFTNQNYSQQKNFAKLPLDEQSFENAKRSAIVKLVKEREQDFKKSYINFTGKVLGVQSGYEIGTNLLDLNVNDLETSQKRFSEHFLNSKNLNIVIMLAKSHAMKMQTIKGLLTHGFKLFT